MPIELSSDRAICSRCGTAFSRRKGYFPVSYAALHRGIGYIPVCKTCIDTMYDSYLSKCEDARLATRQVCRKLDLFWSDSVFEAVEKRTTPRTIMTQYIAKINTPTYVGKSYDDTLSQEGTLWSFGPKSAVSEQKEIKTETDSEDDTRVTLKDVPEEVRQFWGPGYTPATYLALEDRLRDVKATLPDGVDTNDIGTSAILRQICGLELDIARDRESGKPVDRSVIALNTLLGSANLKPVQKKADAAETSLANTPLGVWLYRYENKRPLPEVDDDLKDTNKLLKYVFIWLGHVCKMLGKKNGYTQMYEEEVRRLRIERPEFDDEDDEEAVTDILRDVDTTPGRREEAEDDPEREDS